MASCSTIDQAASSLDSVSPPAKLSAVQLIGGIKCHICKQNFKYKKEFDAHYLEHNGNTKIQYTCTVCARVLARYSTFRDHCYKQHARKEHFKCQHCTKSFSGQTKLNDHVEAVHKFKCGKSNCRLQFATEKELHLHQFVHQCNRNKPPYECQICKDMIDSIDMCEQHIDEHCTVTYSCPICEENLVKKDATTHLKTHFNDEDQTDNARHSVISIAPENSSINIIGGIFCFNCNEIFKNRLEFETHFTADHPNDYLTYTCVICKKQYEKYSLFGSHIYEHLRKNKFGCSQCTRHFPRLALLVEHVEAFHASASRVSPFPMHPFECAQCRQPFASARHRAAHLRLVHGSQRVACAWRGCDAEFASPKELLLHEKQHKSPHDAWCRQCGLHFAALASCEAHLEVHKKKLFLCPVCARPYGEKYTALKHIPQHFVTVLHMCRVCAKIFSSKNRLVDHVKLHSSVKEFHCKHCGKGFMRSNHLEQHITIHTGLRPYKCDLCDKTFASYPNYNKHMRYIHGVDGKMIKKCDVDKTISTTGSSQNSPYINTIWKQNELATDTNQPSTNDEVLRSEGHAADFAEVDEMCADPIAVMMQSDATCETDLNSVNAKANSFFELIQADNVGSFDSAQDILATPSASPSAQPAVIPREYGPDFGEFADLDGAPLPHIPPLLTINPPPPYVSPPTNPHYEYEQYEQNAVESTSKWEPPVFTKFYDTYCGELDEMAATRLSVMNTDIF